MYISGTHKSSVSEISVIKNRNVQKVVKTFILDMFQKISIFYSSLEKLKISLKK